MHIESAVLKLTLFYVIIAVTVSVFFSITIFNISANELEKSYNRQEKIFRDVPNKKGFQALTYDELEQIKLEQINESNNHLKNNLIYFNLLILLLSTGAGYLLARRTLKPIEEAMEAQGRFTADASHELRTPLTAMRTEIEVNLRDKKLSLEKARELLQSNLEETEKLETLSEALLKLSKLDKSIKAEYKKTLIEDVIIEAFEKVESLAVAKSIEFENNIEHLVIKGDRNSLVELFIIILDNAIKYSPEKSTIFISAEKDKDFAIIEIKDSGIGMKASDLPYIFNRFYRADSARSKSVTGYGLGLSIAKSIVDVHDGEITVTSQPNKGSTSRLKFKLLK